LETDRIKIKSNGIEKQNGKDGSKKHWGRSSCFFKSEIKMKRVAFYNSRERLRLKKELGKYLTEDKE
jgi:hypothetical protein